MTRGLSASVYGVSSAAKRAERARPEGPAIPQPRPAAWEYGVRSTRGLKGHDIRPFQGGEIHGGDIPKALPWAEGCRAVGAGTE